MVETQAVVLRADGRRAQVRTTRSSACAACSTAGSGCATNTLIKVFDKAMVFDVADPIGVRPGDRVVLGVHEQALVRATLVTYVLPLLALIAGALIGSRLGSGGARDAYAVAGAVAGLLGGFGVLGIFSSRLAAGAGYLPVLLRRA